MKPDERDTVEDAIHALEGTLERFLTLFYGAGRDTDLRDELLAMEAQIERALNAVGVKSRFPLPPLKKEEDKKR